MGTEAKGYFTNTCAGEALSCIHAQCRRHQRKAAASEMMQREDRRQKRRAARPTLFGKNAQSFCNNV
jgi:hypothetical protein